MWRPLETASMIEKSILMPVFFFSSSSLLPSAFAFTLSRAFNSTFAPSKHWIKRHKTIRATIPGLQTAFISVHLSLIVLIRFLLFSVQEGQISPKKKLRVDSALQTRLLVSNDAVLICYHIHNTTVLLVIFQSSSLLGASRYDCSLLGVWRWLWVISEFFDLFSKSLQVSSSAHLTSPIH